MAYTAAQGHPCSGAYAQCARQPRLLLRIWQVLQLHIKAAEQIVNRRIDANLLTCWMYISINWQYAILYAQYLHVGEHNQAEYRQQADFAALMLQAALR